MDRYTEIHMRRRVNQVWSSLRQTRFLDFEKLARDVEEKLQFRLGAIAPDAATKMETVLSFAELAIKDIPQLRTSANAFPRWYFTELLPYLTGNETKVLFYARHRLLIARDVWMDRMTRPEVGWGTGLGRTAVRNAVRQLERAKVLQWRPSLVMSARDGVDWDWLRTRQGEAKKRNQAQTAAATREARQKRSTRAVS